MMDMKNLIRDNLTQIRERIAAAAARSGRSADDVLLVAVTKTRPIDYIQALLACGHRVLGENRVQEALPKIEALRGQAEWHLIGRLQTNKAKFVPANFDCVHSADSAKLLEALNQAGEKHGTIIRCLLQVNMSHEEQKAGCEAHEAPALLELAANLPHVQIEGLMTMAALAGDPEEARPAFAGLRQLRDNLLKSGIQPERLRHLSMGMSHDYEVAIEEGATMVRIGSAIFRAADARG